MRISFFAALRTFLPSFFRNFLHVYIFIVVLSLALKISQNSSLKDTIPKVLEALCRKTWSRFNPEDSVEILTIWQSDRGHICPSRLKDCCNPSSPQLLNSRMAWPLLTWTQRKQKREGKVGKGYKNIDKRKHNHKCIKVVPSLFIKSDLSHLKSSSTLARVLYFFWVNLYVGKL